MAQYEVDTEEFLMYDGTIKKITELQMDDLLMSDDGTPAKIILIKSVQEKTYRVKTVKGNCYMVGESQKLALRYSVAPHISYYKTTNRIIVKFFDKSLLKLKQKGFCLNNYEGNEQEKKEAANRDAVKYLNEIKEKVESRPSFIINVSDYINSSIKNEMKTFRVPLEFPMNEDVEFDPYIVGFWLGDGTARDSAITTADKEVIEYFTNHMERYGLFLKQIKDITYRITSGKNGNNYKGKNRFLEFLQDNNLINNKHIPLKYLLSSRENRLELLAGLIDSDGNLSHEGFDFLQKREHLLDQVLFLARSLGFACYKSAQEKTCTNAPGGPKTDIYYRCNISGNTDQIPCKIPRKQAEKRQQIKDVLVTGITLEEIEEPITTYRIMTDKNNFLMSDLTVRASYKLRLNIIK